MLEKRRSKRVEARTFQTVALIINNKKHDTAQQVIHLLDKDARPRSTLNGIE